jgi:hypothetical protein
MPWRLHAVCSVSLIRQHTLGILPGCKHIVLCSSLLVLGASREHDEPGA